MSLQRGNSSDARAVNNNHNQPDVVRHEDPNAEVLPPQDVTKSMLNRFREMETQAKVQKQQEWSPRRDKSRSPASGQQITPTPARRWPRSPDGDTDDTDAGAADGSDAYERERPLYNPACPEGGEYENNPIDLPDVVRESDPYDDSELPEVGGTRSLLAKFQSLQA